jgi:RNA polymerase-interacting CarD/CdnL/TRCF family regulator
MSRNTPELDTTIEHLEKVLDDIGEYMKRAKDAPALATATRRYITTEKVARLAILIESLRHPDEERDYDLGWNTCLDDVLRILQSEMPR